MARTGGRKSKQAIRQQSPAEPVEKSHIGKGSS
jgi:hypothetical protein